MDLKYLDLIEPEELSQRHAALFLHNDSINYLAAVKTIPSGSEGSFLSLSLYARNYWKAGIAAPKYILYCSGNAYAVRIFHKLSGKDPTWGCSGIGRLVGRKTSWDADRYGLKGYRVAATDIGDIETAVSFMTEIGESTEGKNIWEVLDAFSGRITRLKREADGKKRQKNLDELMAKAGPVPEGFRKWARKKIETRGRMIYLGVDGTKRRVYLFCERCNGGAEFPLKQLENNPEKDRIYVCPVCGSRLPAKILRGRALSHSLEMNCGLVTPLSDGFVLRSFQCRKQIGFHRRDGKFSVHMETEERLRSFFFYRKGRWSIRRYEYGWCGKYFGWHASRRNGLERVRYSYYYRNVPLTGLSRWGDLELYTANSRSAFRNTPLKYVGLSEISRVSRAGMPCADAVLEMICRNPRAEWLLKMGLYTLAGYAAVEGLERIADPEGKDIYRFLGLDPLHYRLFANAGGTPEALVAAKSVRGFVSQEDFDRFCACLGSFGYQGYNTGYIPQGDWVSVKKAVEMLVTHGATLHKAMNYLIRETADQKTDELCSLYNDYVKMCRDLEKDLRDRWWLMPKNIRNAHDNILIESEEKKRKADHESFDLLLKPIGEKGNLLLSKWNGQKDGNYVVRIPESVNEYLTEGTKLKNCLYTAGYYRMVSKGKTNIAFIRKAEAPETPLYALEWRNGRIIQLHGFKNAAADEDVRRYAERVVAYLEEKGCTA